jgi:cystathionine beta-synthase
VKGYKCTFVMPDKQSEEKRAALRAYGARVVITPTAVEADDPRSYYSVSRRLGHEPGAFFANQYHNPSNPAAHYNMTGPEIWEQLDGQIDVLIVRPGHRRHGLGHREVPQGEEPQHQGGGRRSRGVVVLRLLPHRAAHPGLPYVVEGIGEDFMPSTIDWQYIDDVVRVNDRECMHMTRRVVREEGILCGGSCGAAVAGAVKWVRQHDAANLKVLVILPDSGSRYLSKIFNDNWMKEMGFTRGRERLRHRGRPAPAPRRA